MRLTTTHVNSSEEIAEIMHEIVERFHRDMRPFFHWSIPDLFNYVKNLPYRYENVEAQFLSRPIYVINDLAPFVACANKCICLASYFRLHKIPFRFVLCNHKKDSQLDHVFLEVLAIGKKWLPIDATYSKYSIVNGPEKYVDCVRV